MKNSGFGEERRGPRRGAPQPACARGHGKPRGFKRAAARVGVSVVLASVLRLAAALEGGAATLSASLHF